MTNIWKLQHWQNFEGLYVKKIDCKLIMVKFRGLIWKKVGAVSGFIKKIKDLRFWHFLGFLGIVFV
jgi:hypothetical protein